MQKVLDKVNSIELAAREPHVHTITVPRCPTSEELMADPCASNWLKAALMRAIQRDPVDALMDAELLTLALAARLEVIQSPPTEKP
jgi:hypothetical protein